MADKIEASIAPKELVLAPGDNAEATATLHNLGQSVDQFTLSVDGLDPGWYTLPVSSVALFPNDVDNLKLVLHPPKGDDTKAGSYTGRINVASQENPGEVATVEIIIEIRAVPRVELSISPESASGRYGAYQILLNNPGESEATLNLKAGDAGAGLQYSLRPESLTVPAGGNSQVELEVRMGLITYLGFGEKVFDFQVAATPGGGTAADETPSVSGQLVRIPWYRILKRVRIPKIRIPWLARQPVITEFKATSLDQREFTLKWSTKRATGVRLNDQEIGLQGEEPVYPGENASYVLSVMNKHGQSSQTLELRPAPAPQARVSERIRASLTATELQAYAGGPPVVASLELQNLGDIVDKFLVSVDGLDEDWYSRSASSIALFPQASQQVQISFQVPKKKGIRARSYPFALKISSQSLPQEYASIVAEIQVLPSAEFKLQVRPYRISARRKGTFRINLANTSVSNLSLTLSATDLDEGLRFFFKDENPSVTAWNTIEVPVVAKPKRGSGVGERRRYDITVTATDGDGNSQTVNCELHHRPFMASWKPVFRLIRAIIVLGALGVGGYYLLRLGGGWRLLRSSPQSWVNQLVRVVEGFFSR